MTTTAAAARTTAESLRDNLEAVTAHLDALWDAIDADGWICIHCGELEDEHPAFDHDEYEPVEHDERRTPLEELEAYPLEVVWERGEPFAVVLATGGPHVEITGGGRSGGYQLEGYWGGDRDVIRGRVIERTGELFRSQLEEDG